MCYVIILQTQKIVSIQAEVIHWNDKPSIQQQKQTPQYLISCLQ